ncbi:LOW QUALITY PROTEIN: hypothetical protein HID58_072686 [Brassica napus]|uniref:Uncharacterized protein n=1 Tax=Brassica napus TaxID=3708 RepID=A0ABQ7Z538_BRANA|nr:LOW QUALITY PROTEIN: hypothetical protein HID58_072686 [Brassica napus]
MAGSTLLSPFLTRRTKIKFVVTPPANVTETLLIKPGSSVNIEIPAFELETRGLFLYLIHEQGETKASEDDTQSSKFSLSPELLLMSGRISEEEDIAWGQSDLCTKR